MNNRGQISGKTAGVTTALSTDRYELTMVDAALRSGVAHRRSVFEVFTRYLPAGRRYGVVAGMNRVIETINSMTFSTADIEALQAMPGFTMSPALHDWLTSYRFSGDVVGYREGELFTANSPILTVVGTFAEAVVLETIVLSILNHDCAVASAASVMVEAAKGRSLIEMGSRRTDPDAAIAAARAAIVGGFTATSNLEAGHRYGLVTAGTSAHAFVLAHDDERAAFVAQVEALGTATTLLVDTFDIEQGIRTAIDVCQSFGAPGPSSIRIDSGDPFVEVVAARKLLDHLGATATTITLSGDLDAEMIALLTEQNLPVDVFGVGTSVVTGDGHPTASLAYKLVEIADARSTMRPVAKLSTGKATVAGRKWAYRSGNADRIVVSPEPIQGFGEPLQRVYIDQGASTSLDSISEAQALLRHRRASLGQATLEASIFEGMP